MLNAIFGKNVFGQDGGALEPEPAAAQEAAPPTAATLDVKHAIDSHVRWRLRIEDFLRGNSIERLSAEKVGATDQCELGQWLHGDGQARYGHLDLFTELATAHELLHKHSGFILNLAAQGKREEALSHLLAVEYSRATAKVKHLLAKIYVEVLCAENPVRGHLDPHPPATHR